MAGMYVKGFAIDDTKVDEKFDTRLPKEKLWGVYLDLVDEAKEKWSRYLPLFRASDDDRDKLEATPIEKDPKAEWLEQFLEEEAGIFLRY